MKENTDITPPFKKQPIEPPGIEAKMDPHPLYESNKYIGSKKLLNKKALITGGDSGIGRAVAVLFAREGAQVAFTYLPEEEEDAQITAKAVEQEEASLVEKIAIDLTKDGAAEFAIQRTVERFARIDILVNNAAFQKHQKKIEQLSFDQFLHTFDVNIFTYFKLVKAALPHLYDGSVIINTGSILGYTGNSQLIDYASTKGAIHSFTKSLAQHLASRNIRVNSVAPGPVWTPLNPAERTDEDIKDFGADTLFGRPAQPQEIAPAFVFLASDITASYITGETINIFGSISGGN